MMSRGVPLSGLPGANPLGFFAALGALTVLDRQRDPAVAPPRLSWTDTVLPIACLDIGDVDELVEATMAELPYWRNSPALEFSIDADEPVRDVKLSPSHQRKYLLACRKHGEASERLGGALVAEWAVDNSGRGKPTDLHFTAGQQQFLAMARQLRDGVSAEDIRVAAVGPWPYNSKLPSFMWDTSDDRVYALSASDPSTEKKLTTPGVEWLALMGIACYPLYLIGSRTRIAGSTGTWKRGRFRWPLWNSPLTLPTVRAAVASDFDDAAINGPQPPDLVRVLESGISRSDQGGYGTFGPPRVVWERPRIGG
jgi:hypothetical protein